MKYLNNVVEARSRQAGSAGTAPRQASLVYLNTRMVQSVLGDPVWAARLSSDDLRGLSPLIYTHINPHGRFEVDLDRRIDFERKAA